MDTRWLTLFIITVGFSALGQYRLDLKNPIHVTESIPRVQTPSRVGIYLTGPGIYIDNSDTHSRLMSKAPLCLMTNATDIQELMSILQPSDNQDRIPNISKMKGYTYHLLLFQDSNKTVMHFRVFETTEVKSSWCDVFPRNDTGFGYFNKQIGAWLHTRLGKTNAASFMGLVSTNSPNKTPPPAEMK